MLKNQNKRRGTKNVSTPRKYASQLLMFTLTLQQFRGWKNITVSFPEKKVTLIHGPSGIGKTTLFEAVEWMLFGKLKGVEPLTGGSPSVTLDGPKWSIQRLSTSNVRVFDKELNTYFVDSDAQRYIEAKFFPLKTWRPCCYIKQKSFNSFLEGTNAEKMSFLNALAFHGDDPSTYYTKLDERIRFLKEEVLRAQQAFDYANGRYSALSGGVELVDATQKEERWRYLKQHILDMEKQNLTQARLEERKNTLQRELLSLQPPLAPPSFDTIDTSTLEKENNDHLRYVSLRLFLASLPVSEAPSTYTTQELEDVIKKETRIQQCKQILSRHAVAYNNALEAYKQKCVSFLQGEAVNTENHKRQRAIEERDKNLSILRPPQTIVAVPEPVTPSVIDLSSLQEERGTIQRRLEELRQTLGKNFLRCPHCQKNTHYANGLLHSADDLDVSLLQEEKKNCETRLRNVEQTLLSEQMRQQNEMRQYTSLLQQYTSYLHQQQRYTEEKAKYDLRKQELENLVLPSPTLPLQPLDKYAKVRTMYESIRDLVYEEEPALTSATMRDAMRKYEEYRQRETRRLRLQSEIDSFSTIPQDRREELRSYRAKEEELRLFRNKKEDYDRRRERMTQEIEGIIVPSFVDLLPLRQEFQTLQSVLQDNHNFLLKKQAYDTTAPLYQKHITLRDELQRQHHLRQVMTDVECHNLQEEVVNTVNGVVSKVCGPIFKEPIHIELRLFKDMKSGMKPGVNFLVSYKGGTLGDLSRLSGGEKDRASLAISLAFNSRSTFPLLMLDECFASLDDELKEASVDSLRAQLDTTMLVIMHDGVKGIYDHDINLGEF